MPSPARGFGRPISDGPALRPLRCDTATAERRQAYMSRGGSRIHRAEGAGFGFPSSASSGSDGAAARKAGVPFRRGRTPQSSNRSLPPPARGMRARRNEPIAEPPTVRLLSENDPPPGPRASPAPFSAPSLGHSKRLRARRALPFDHDAGCNRSCLKEHRPDRLRCGTDPEGVAPQGQVPEAAPRGPHPGDRSASVIVPDTEDTEVVALDRYVDDGGGPGAPELGVHLRAGGVRAAQDPSLSAWRPGRH